MDYEAMTDEELAHVQHTIAGIQQRRAVFSGIPLQITELAVQYAADGGDLAALTAAVEEARNG